MQKTFTLVVSAIALLSPLVALKPADASTLVTVQSQSSVYDGNVQYDSPSALTSSNILAPLSISSYIAIPGAVGSGQTTGAAGILKAKSSGSASGSSSILGGDSQGASSTNVSIQDSVTLNSSTLAYGTPVSILFSMLVEGSVPISGNDNPNYFGTATLSFFTNTLIGQPVELLFRSDLDTNYTLVGNQRHYNQRFTGVYGTTVGAEIPIAYQLLTQATARSKLGQTLEAVTDFGHTGLFYIDSQTAGVTLVSESGHNYASPTAVPTPALLPGLMVLGASMLRKRKKVCA